MRRRPTRRTRRVPWLSRLLGGLMGGLANVMIFTSGSAVAAPGPGEGLPEGWVNTQWGPLDPAGRALINGVRRANLWEGPAGQMAVQRGVSPKVREIGAVISGQHVNELDPATVKIAAQLGLNLPSQPSAEQLGWLMEMERARGIQFDQVFVDRLRLAHSNVFQLIATVRANTRNSLVRQFAITANRYVDGHIKFLDSTGLVRYEELPTPAAPAVATLAGQGVPAVPSTGVSRAVIWVVAVLAVLAVVVASVRILRHRRVWQQDQEWEPRQSWDRYEEY